MRALCRVLLQRRCVCRDCFTHFCAAFPSISRSFIIAVRRPAGSPLTLIHLACATWHAGAVVDDAGRRMYGIERGVGQGCSASAILFAIGIEPLLRAIGARLDPTRLEIMSVFADDIAFATLSCLFSSRLVCLCITCDGCL